jgi:hypothetical protein
VTNGEQEMLLAKANNEVVSIAYLSGKCSRCLVTKQHPTVKTTIGLAEEAMLMYEDPEFKSTRNVAVRMYHKHTAKGTYFFDYGNAFLLEASRCGNYGRK